MGSLLEGNPEGPSQEVPTQVPLPSGPPGQPLGVTLGSPPVPQEGPTSAAPTLKQNQIPLVPSLKHTASGTDAFLSNLEIYLTILKQT